MRIGILVLLVSVAIQTQARDPKRVAPQPSASLEQAAALIRAGQFDEAIAILEQLAAEKPDDPKGHQLVAVHYHEKVQKDLALPPADKLRYIDRGIAAADRALALNGDSIDSLTYKNILLRMKANLEPAGVSRDQLIAEAEMLRKRAIELSKASAGNVSDPRVPGAPPPPPPPPAPGAPVRVGGNIPTPTKISDLRPVYPPEALSARVSGMVILEIVIDGEGNVSSAKVLRSIALLDQAAIDAVKGWRYRPTLLNGAPVPVVMTVTVNFAIQ